MLRMPSARTSPPQPVCPTQSSRKRGSWREAQPVALAIELRLRRGVQACPSQRAGFVTVSVPARASGLTHEFQRLPFETCMRELGLAVRWATRHGLAAERTPNEHIHQTEKKAPCHPGCKMLNTFMGMYRIRRYPWLPGPGSPLLVDGTLGVLS